MYISLAAALLGLVAVRAAPSCPENLPLSCSQDAMAADSCCVFEPGLLGVSQIWNKERQQWVIDDVQVYSCDGISSYQNCGSSYPPHKIHGLIEGYARNMEPLTNVTRSLGWGGIALNASDDDVWEQTGSCISTFQSECFDKNMPPGEDDAWIHPGPALFVQMMQALQRKLMRVEPPSLNEFLRKRHYLHSYGSPHLGDFVEEPALTQNEEKQQQNTGKLSFFAQRELRRADEEHKREQDHSRWTEHDEL